MSITFDGGLLAYRELDHAVGLTAMAAAALAEGRRGSNIRHRLLGLLRQAIGFCQALRHRLWLTRGNRRLGGTLRAG